MTNQEIVKEQRKVSHMILESIEEKHDINQLAGLLARQRWLNSEIKEDDRDSVKRVVNS